MGFGHDESFEDREDSHHPSSITAHGEPQSQMSRQSISGPNRNPVDHIVTLSIRHISRLVLGRMVAETPLSIRQWLRVVLDGKRLQVALRKVSNPQSKLTGIHSRKLLNKMKSVFAMCDTQIFTGLGILISGFFSLCPTAEGAEGLSSYHWHNVVFLTWTSSITHQSALVFLQAYFRRHHWQRTWRIILMGTLQVLLLVSMIPIAYFNWYHKRFPMHIWGESDNGGPPESLFNATILSQSAAIPSTPAICFFDLDRANSLFHAADRCLFADLEINPSIFDRGLSKRILSGMVPETTPLGSRVPYSYHIPDSVSQEVYSSVMRDLICNHDTTLLGTAAFQSTVVFALGSFAHFVFCVLQLFDYPSSRFKNSIRPVVRKSFYQSIDQVLQLDAKLFKSPHGHKIWNVIVIQPIIALYLLGQLLLDFIISDLFSVGTLEFIPNFNLTQTICRYTFCFFSLR